MRETARVEWNRAAERVESVSALWFDQIAIEESRGAADPEAAAALLASKAMEAGLARFDDIEAVEAYLNRARFAAHTAQCRFPIPKAALRAWPPAFESFAELEAAARGAVVRAMEQQLPPAARRLLEEIAPERIKLPRGRSVAVHYEAGPAAVDRFAPAGFFRHAGHAHGGARSGAGGGAPARAQSAPGADDQRPAPASGSASTRRYGRNSRGATRGTPGRKTRGNY